MSFKFDLDLTPSAIGMPIEPALGIALKTKLLNSNLSSLLVNKGISFPSITIDITSFRSVIKPKHTDFIYQYFAIQEKDTDGDDIKEKYLTILFRLNNNGNYFKVNNGIFSSIGNQEALSYIGAYIDNVPESTVGYTKCLWSEYTSETSSFFDSLPNNTLWEIHFGYVDINIKNTPNICITEYEKEYLNTYHDHLTAVSKITVPDGKIFYRDADIICPPRCGVS